MYDGLDCRTYDWAVEKVDLEADRLYMSAADCTGQQHTIIFSSADYNDAWRFDLNATLAANPNAQPLPLPDGVTVVVTVVQVPLPFRDLPEDRSMEALLNVPNSRTVCTAEGPLRQNEPTELVCEGSTLGTPTHFEFTGLWGDPNPRLVAVAITEAWGRRYEVVPLGWNIGTRAFHGAGPIEAVFFRFEQRHQ